MSSRRSRRGVSRRGTRSTAAFQSPGFALNLTVNTTLTASTVHYETANSALTAASAVLRPTSICVRAASATPTNLVVTAQTSNDGTTWTTVYESAVTLIGTNAQLYRLRAPRNIEFKFYARWGLLSSGAPVIAGYVTFGVRDPVGAS